MKKFMLIALLIPLVLFELAICTTFLPLEWQHAISERIPRILSESPSDWSRVTHPRMDLELEKVFREHLWLRIASYVFMALMLAANTILMRLVWRRVRAIERVSADHS